MSKSLASRLASLVGAIANCKKFNNTEWLERHTETLEQLTKNHLPSGSGFDNGTHFWLDQSSASKLVFRTFYHHMDEYGGYDGWTDHNVIVTPLFDGFEIKVTGRNRNDIKDYIAETFHAALGEPIADQPTEGNNQ